MVVGAGLLLAGAATNLLIRDRAAPPPADAAVAAD
jgi:hypothetical protein